MEINSMWILADSGSTKTDWCLYSGNEAPVFIKTGGINPYMMEPEAITQLVEKEITPLLIKRNAPEYKIRFYGAGCTLQKIGVVQSALQKAFNQTGQAEIEVASDLLGAARSLCQRQPGMAAILGTGSNSCYYDGHDIIQNVSPLGFILGDEGSGAVLGKLLVGQLLKGHWPTELKEAFMQQYQLTPADIIQKVYREPQPNRFLASLSPFLHAHRLHPCVHDFLVVEFARFFRHNILHYSHPELPVHCTGSIAYYYQEELTEAAHSMGVQLGRIVQSPLQGLMEYHQQMCHFSCVSQ